MLSFDLDYFNYFLGKKLGKENLVSQSKGLGTLKIRKDPVKVSAWRGIHESCKGFDFHSYSYLICSMGLKIAFLLHK